MGEGGLQGGNCGGEKILGGKNFWGRDLVGLQRKNSGG